MSTTTRTKRPARSRRSVYDPERMMTRLPGRAPGSSHPSENNPPKSIQTMWNRIPRRETGTVRLTKACKLKLLYPAIRSSGAGDFHTCNRLFFFRHRWGLKTRGSYKSAAAVGTVYHEMLYMLLTGATIEGAIAHTGTLLATAIEQLTAAAVPSKMQLLPDGRPLEDVLKRARKDCAVGQAMAAWAWRAAPIDTSRFKPLALEKVLTVKFKSLASPVKMRLDLLLHDTEHDAVWIVDYKTTGRLTPLARSASLPYSFQQKLYRLVVSTIDLDGLNLVGFIHHLIATPTIRQKQTETLDEYVTRVGTNYTEKMRTDDPPFISSWLRFSGPPMDDEMLVQLREQSGACRARGSLACYPRTGESTCRCHPYERPCEFLPLCRSAQSQWPAIIENGYVVAPRTDDTEASIL